MTVKSHPRLIQVFTLNVLNETVILFFSLFRKVSLQTFVFIIHVLAKFWKYVVIFFAENCKNEQNGR